MAKKEQDPTMYFAEDEQTERIRHWWKKNGVAIIVGLVLGIGSVAGYNGWGVYQTRQAESASDIYQQMLRSLENETVTQVRESSERLISEYGSTAYADAASLMLARLDVDAGNLEQAGSHLSRVINNSKDPAMQHIARLRLVTLALDQSDLELVDQLLTGQLADGFESRYDELRGDMFVARNDLNSARNAYQRALTNAAAGSVAAQILERKLNSVSRADNQQ
jgi:predicted negative regulator of RcsB-dependent stress response